MTTKRSDLTAPGVSDPQGSACSGSIVPAPLTSLSNEGPAGVLPTSTPVELVFAEKRREEREIDDEDWETDDEEDRTWDGNKCRMEIDKETSQILHPGEEDGEHEVVVKWLEGSRALDIEQAEARISDTLGIFVALTESARRGIDPPEVYRSSEYNAGIVALLCRSIIDRLEEVEEEKNRAHGEVAALQEKKKTADLELAALREKKKTTDSELAGLREKNRVANLKLATLREKCKAADSELAAFREENSRLREWGIGRRLLQPSQSP